MSEQATQLELLAYTTDIVSAYVSNKSIEPEEIKRLIQTVYQSLFETSKTPYILRSNSPLSPAVSIDDSIQDDYIICLEDGKRLQMLKRHLKTVYNMSIDQYKERWGLPHDYPVVAPSYAKRRSEIAKNTGLGMTGRRKRFKKVSASDGLQSGIVVNR